MSEGRLSPLIVPIFIPNQGCPHRCIFCEQERITSQQGQSINKQHVQEVLDTSIRSKGFALRSRPEVAFYGGTFTRLPIERMRELLQAVAPYISKGLFDSIRVSTRPDALDKERLELIKAHGVTTVELGVQSMDDEVLSLSQRGHTSEDTIKAVQTLRINGFRVGIQLMPGLPGDSDEKFRATIDQIIGLHPDMVRLYPAVVIRGTELALWYRQGRYLPMTLENAVGICMDSCIRLEEKGIPVIRIGLMSSPSLLEKGEIIAGPWHTAFGFLVRSGIYHRRIEPFLPNPGTASQINISVPEREVPLVRGYRNQGLELIEKKTKARVIKVEPDDSVPPGTIRVKKV